MDSEDVIVVPRPSEGVWRAPWEDLEDLRTDGYISLAEAVTLVFHPKDEEWDRLPFVDRIASLPESLKVPLVPVPFVKTGWWLSHWGDRS